MSKTISKACLEGLRQLQEPLNIFRRIKVFRGNFRALLKDLGYWQIPWNILRRLSIAFKDLWRVHINGRSILGRFRPLVGTFGQFQDGLQIFGKFLVVIKRPQNFLKKLGHLKIFWKSLRPLQKPLAILSVFSVVFRGF